MLLDLEPGLVRLTISLVWPARTGVGRRTGGDIVPETDLVGVSICLATGKGLVLCSMIGLAG